MFVILLVIGAAFYFLPKIRRDKQGKIYFFSQRYEDRKRNKKWDEMKECLGESRKDLDIILDKIEVNTERLEKLELLTLKLEILENVHNTPDKVERISELFDVFFAKGGDGYMHQVWEIWKKEHAADVLSDRFGRQKDV
ncbi:MAG: hypothetical protein MdMp014T_0466 [Treponematales bacterium]